MPSEKGLLSSVGSPPTRICDETFILSSSRAASFLPSGSPSSLLCWVVDIIAAEHVAGRVCEQLRMSAVALGEEGPIK